MSFSKTAKLAPCSTASWCHSTDGSIHHLKVRASQRNTGLESCKKKLTGICPSVAKEFGTTEVLLTKASVKGHPHPHQKRTWMFCKSTKLLHNPRKKRRKKKEKEEFQSILSLAPLVILMIYSERKRVIIFSVYMRLYQHMRTSALPYWASFTTSQWSGGYPQLFWYTILMKNRRGKNIYIWI